MSCEELPDVGFIFKLGWRGRLLGRLAKHRDEEQEGCDGAELSCVGVVEYISFLVCRKSSNISQCKNVIAFILRSTTIHIHIIQSCKRAQNFSHARKMTRSSHHEKRIIPKEIKPNIPSPATRPDLSVMKSLVFNQQ
jgi:hypothetical protein